jgi:hypothetical protein
MQRSIKLYFVFQTPHYLMHECLYIYVDVQISTKRMRSRYRKQLKVGEIMGTVPFRRVKAFQ